MLLIEAVQASAICREVLQSWLNLIAIEMGRYLKTHGKGDNRHLCMPINLTHRLCRPLRGRVEAPTHCEACTDLVYLPWRGIAFTWL